MIYRAKSFSSLISGLGAGVLFFMIISAFTFHTIPLLNPLPKTRNVADLLRPALMKKPNLYTLQIPTRFPHAVLASVPDLEPSSAYVVIDYDTGDIISEHNLDTRLPVASLTKMMTAIVALDLAAPHELFTVSQAAADKIPTKIGLQKGERLTLEELLHASLLTSANDATETIREGIEAKYGSTVFIDAMNMKAKMLGLTATHFENPQGFDSSANYSSVHDLAILSHYALTEYPLIATIVKKDYMLLPATATHRSFDLYNWNGLLGVYPAVFGVKIGNTDAAGTTTVVASERDGHRVLVVLLGTSGVLQRDLGAARLLDAGFEDTWGLKPVEVTEEQLRAKYGTWKYWN